MSEKKNKKKDSTPAGQRPWRDVSTFAGGPGQRWTGWASGIVIVGLVVVSLMILFAPGPDKSAPPAAPSASPTASAAGSNEEKSVCPAAATDEGATQSPSDIAWTSAYGNSWPVSATVGPKRSIDGLGRCFDRSPVGAALAAVNLTQSLRTADQATAHRILDTQYVPNAGKDAAAAGVDEFYPQQPPQTRQLGRVMGYKVIAFSPSLARVLLVENWPQRGQYTGFTVTLEWAGGDWQVALDSSGAPSPDGDITVDPDGFTPWESAQ